MKQIGLLCLIFLFSSSVFSQSYNELVQASFDYIEKNDLFSAEESLKEAMRKEPANPQNVMLLSNLGTIQKRQGKPEEALISYNSALSGNPNNTTLLYNRANLYVEMGETDKAIMDYSSLLVSNEKHEGALYERGLLYLSRNDFFAAEADFEKLLDVNPNSLEARKGYANLYKLRGEYDEAEKIYFFLLERVKDDPNLLLGRAELYLLTEKNGRASVDINKAISLEQQQGIANPYSYILRARLKIRQYEKKGAQKDIERAVELGYDAKKAKELLELCR